MLSFISIFSDARSADRSPRFICCGVAELSFIRQHTFELLLVTVFFRNTRVGRHAYARVAVARINTGVIRGIVAILIALAVTISLGSSARFIYFDF